jgi:hypothetical protein
VIEGAMIPCRADVSVGDVRSALVSWAAAESGVVRMDRPLREIEGAGIFTWRLQASALEPWR